MKIDIDIIQLIHVAMIFTTLFLITKLVLNYRIKKMILDNNIQDKDAIKQIMTKGIKIKNNAGSKQFGLLLLIGGLAIVLSMLLELDAGIFMGVMMLAFGGVLFFYPQSNNSDKD